MQRNCGKLIRFISENETMITRSKRDKEAIDLLDAKTLRLDIAGTVHYATPLSRK